MPAPRRPAPLERPDPVVLLMDAVINRQSDLAQRLAQQWIHRRGLAAFTALSQADLRRTCGDEGIIWLQQQLGLDIQGAPVGVAEGSAAGQAPAQANQPESTEPESAPPGHPLGHLIREALAEALTPLRQSGTAPAAPLGADPSWQWPPLPRPTSTVAEATPAPAPAGLAGLRAWLHRDAA